jgi:hypothetical protein
MWRRCRGITRGSFRGSSPRDMAGYTMMMAGTIRGIFLMERGIVMMACLYILMALFIGEKSGTPWPVAKEN